MPKTELNEQDCNLLVVAAVEGFAHSHKISAKDAYKTLALYAVPKLIRENYESLHTQDLSEVVNFAEDIVKRNTKQ